MRQSCALSIPLDFCTSIECGQQTLFGENDYVNMAFDIGFNLPEAATMTAPITFNVAVLDEVGTRVAGDKVQFISSGTQIIEQAQENLEAGKGYWILINNAGK